MTVAMERTNIPDDLIEEILSRIPAKSLARLRSTSKRWNSLLKSERFAKIHSAKSPKESLIVLLMGYKVYVVSVNNNLHEIHNYNVALSVKLATQFYLKDPFSNSSQVNIRDIFHCDGLLLCSTMDNRLVVWNPCSGETKWIKPRNSYQSSDRYALGYDNKSSCKKYKILRMPTAWCLTYIEYEIYDFTTDSWRVLGGTFDWYLLQSYSGVSLKGNTFLVAFESRAPYEGFLLSFDFSKEGIRKLPLPHQYRNSHKVLSTAIEDQLYFCATSSTELHVWVTPISTRGSVVSWSNPLNVSASGKREYDFSCGVSFLANEKNKLVLCCNRYIDEDSHVDIMCSDLLNYVPSLVPIQQATCDL